MTAQSAPVATAADVRRLVRKRTVQSYVVSLAVTVVVTVLASADWMSSLLVLPSLLLGSAVFFAGHNGRLHPVLVAVSAVVGTCTLIWAALEHASPAGSAGLAMTAGAWITQQRSRGELWSIVTTGLASLSIAAISCLAILTNPEDAPMTVVLLTMVGVIWLSVIVETGEQDHYLNMLEQAQNAERELSILRERNRFAADLHDIQGHSLHVIKLKAAVAAKLQHSDPQRTADELEAIGKLTAETIEQGRQLANSTHQLVLAAELTNAVELFEAAGIEVQVQRSEEEESHHDDARALVLREATTNILRHSKAAQVTIRLDAGELMVHNDGATAGPVTLRGLATLGERLAESGGELDVDHCGETFTLTASFTGTVGQQTDVGNSAGLGVGR